MTIDDYYHRQSDAGTEHLAVRVDGPALCGYDFETSGELVMDTDGGVDRDDVCKRCLGEVR